MTVEFGAEAAPGDGTGRADGRRTLLLVTGMHRAGTSALARTLSLLGASLPDALVPANAGNPHGHWEPQGMVDLNDRMLADMGSDLYSALDADPAWFEGPAATGFAAEAAALVDASFGTGRLLVMKDPRTALLAPVWNRAAHEAGCRAAHVLPLRHPAEVADSLRRRHLKDFPYDAWAPPRGEAVWLRYTLAAVRASRGHPRAFLRYGALLADWRGEVDRLGRDLGLAWPGRGTAAEAEIDAFLHGNENAGAPRPRTAIEERDPRGLDLAGLAAALHDRLAAVGDDGAGVDAVASDVAARLGGARDLVATLENLYPLVWHQWRDAEAGRERVAASALAEARLRESVQRHWAALTRANADKLALGQDLGSRDRHVADLDAEVARLRGALAAAEAAGAAPAQGRDAEAEARTAAAEDGLARLAAEAADLRDALAARSAEVAAMLASTSWRVTRGLRSLSRAVRGRP